MGLKEIINEDLKTALKNGEKLRLETIRSIRALILEFEKNGSGKELDEATEIAILTGAAKKRSESIEQFRNAGRNELADKEEAELAIIRNYLPKQLSRDEIIAEIKKISVETGSKEFPKIMPLAAKSLKGRADGKTVKELVEDYIKNN
ncbi:MAG: GatB/YqeY domain-containing protein [Ignavibacteriales bacterium]|nr:GatB/YqeY domain-containing protein [Ignavibacteriales bacterium]